MNYAPNWPRFLAFLIDAVILWIVNFVLMLILGGILRDMPALTWGIGLVISIGYWVFYQYKMGQTIGKKAMGLKVVDASGKKPSQMTFFMREIIGKFISGILLGIGYLMILWDKKKQGLHDKIAGTFVVKA